MVLGRPHWATAVRQRGGRCLVPASGWYEWPVVPGQKVKQPWFITDPDGDDLLGLAGLLDRWVDRDGTPRAACAIITTAAATDDLRALHDRMPVVLSRQAEDMWLDLAVTAAEAVRPLLVHPKAEQLRRWPVSTAVNRSGHSDPALIGPLNPA